MAEAYDATQGPLCRNKPKTKEGKKQERALRPQGYSKTPGYCTMAPRPCLPLNFLGATAVLKPNLLWTERKSVVKFLLCSMIVVHQLRATNDS